MLLFIFVCANVHFQKYAKCPHLELIKLNPFNVKRISVKKIVMYLHNTVRYSFFLHQRMILFILLNNTAKNEVR